LPPDLPPLPLPLPCSAGPSSSPSDPLIRGHVGCLRLRGVPISM
jgi:hypothetical protein